MKEGIVPIKSKIVLAKTRMVPVEFRIVLMKSKSVSE
jgi:hypothetical protein